MLWIVTLLKYVRGVIQSFPFLGKSGKTANDAVLGRRAMLFNAIYSHLNENKPLTSNQSGFRPGDSTINQLLFITHKIYCAFDDTPSKEKWAVFLDLSKAFDRVWH